VANGCDSAEKSMNAKIRSNPIRPDRDRGIMGQKIVMRTRNARKKLSPRSSTQKGNSGASVGLGVVWLARGRMVLKENAPSRTRKVRNNIQVTRVIAGAGSCV